MNPKHNSRHNHTHKQKRFVIRPPTATKSRKQQLPVDGLKDKFIAHIRTSRNLIVVGETGSGKTTQIPQWCIDYCYKQFRNGRTPKLLSVACTQPRRVAAMSVASRVASERNSILGQEVGYSVRFEACTSPKTRLKYLTDGMMLREAMVDNLLSSYGVIILDEAHERTIQTEILLGVVKRAFQIRNRPQSDSPLLVIVMSATINTKLFKRFLQAPILHIPGRQHPVQDYFAENSQSDLMTSTLITVFQIHRSHEKGDILVFCSGQDEILSLITMCKKVLKQAPESLQNLTPLPLYASLPAHHQMKVFETSCSRNSNGVEKNGVDNSDASSESSINQSATNSHSLARRVIFATNVAETSVTIPNINFVIDTGRVKCRFYCPKTGLESLKVIEISQAQAKQRSGRAGRLGPGQCYRLYTEEEFNNMNDFQAPEIRRCNLDGIILQLISMGNENMRLFEFLERPDDERVESAINNLVALKAIRETQPNKNDQNGHNNCVSSGANGVTTNGASDQLDSMTKESNNPETGILTRNYELTDLGRKLCHFPLSPTISRIIFAADELGCLDEALTIVSLIYIDNLFHIPPNRQAAADVVLEKFKSIEGDAIMLLKAYRAFRRTYVLNKKGLKMWCIENFINTKNLKLARLVRKQLFELCKAIGMRISSCGQDTSLVRRALTHGLFSNVATMWNGKYRNKSCDEIHIHPSSCLFKSRPECLLYMEVVETNKCYMRNCTLIDLSWVRDVSSRQNGSPVTKLNTLT